MHDIRNQTTKKTCTGERLMQIHRTYSLLNNKDLSLKKGKVQFPRTAQITYLVRHSFKNKIIQY